jgi:hypothetical protein
VFLDRLRQSDEVHYCIMPPEEPLQPTMLRIQAFLPQPELGLTLLKRLIQQRERGPEQVPHH